VPSRITFSQLLAKAHEIVRAHFPETQVMKDAGLTGLR
jgi:hypothetical protein